MYNNGYAYAEVLDILDKMDEKYIRKIPYKLLETLKINSYKGYKQHINPNIELGEQHLSSKTLDILAVINLKYWVEDEKHKKELLEQYRNNEIREREESIKQYQNVFEKKARNGQCKEMDLPVVIEKEGLIKKLFNKVLKLFRAK